MKIIASFSRAGSTIDRNITAINIKQPPRSEECGGFVFKRSFLWLKFQSHRSGCPLI